MNDNHTLPPWVLVCGGFHRLGGMDRANLAIAEALLEQGREVFLVGHHFDSGLLRHPRIHAAVVPQPLGVLLAEGSLKRAGIRVATQVTRRHPDTRVVVNGGNCPWPDINWVHSVHAAWPRFDAHAPLWFRAKSQLSKQKACRDELYALQHAKLVIANSQRTRRDLIAIGIPSEKIQVIYFGSEPDWRPPTNAERQEARKSFGLSQDTNVVSFVGGLGYDCNKGFDTLLAAWKEANLDDAVLLAAGAGRGFIHWRREIERLGQHGRVRLLGFTDRVADLLNASDLFVSPVRYEAFGMNVLEAIYRGVPSIVSKSAGISELYPKELSDWLLDDPEDVHSLREALRAWHKNVDFLRSKLDMVSLNLREHTMKQMGQKLISVAEGDKK